MSELLRPIPEGSVEIQTGLWAHQISFTVGNTTYSFYDVYSAEGYCFYNVEQPENYDEEGNLKPPAERMYAQFASTPFTTIDELNANFVSVPVEDGFEIVSVPSNPSEVV